MYSPRRERKLPQTARANRRTRHATSWNLRMSLITQDNQAVCMDTSEFGKRKNEGLTIGGGHTISIIDCWYSSKSPSGLCCNPKRYL